jgi:hypothetical protein
MANVDKLHRVGALAWALIETIKEGATDNEADVVQDVIADAVALQQLVVAVIEVKDDLDTKPEAIPAVMNIAAGMADAAAESLREAPDIPPV